MKGTKSIGVLILFGALLSVSLLALKGFDESGLVEIAPLAEVAHSAVDSEQSLPTMVAVYSDWCPSCRHMKPIVEDIVDQCDGKGVLVKKVDFDDEDNRDMMELYDVEGLPTFLFLDENGMEVDRLVGSHGRSVLKEMLSLIRGEKCPA